MKNLVALLLVSYISMEQFVVFLAKAEQQAITTEGRGMLRAISKSRDGDHQALQMNDNHKDSDSESDPDAGLDVEKGIKLNAVEGPESGSDDDDIIKDKDDDATEFKMEAKVEKHEPTHAEMKPIGALAQGRDQFGRDFKGNYLDQKSFIASRNQLNQKEEAHRHMYNTVNEKLEDPDYLGNALQAAGQVDNQVEQAAVERLLQKLKAEKDATDDAESLSEQEAQCYLDRYPDVQASYGRTNAVGAS